MRERRAFPLRLDPKVLGALELWARDDLRSLNAQIEFVLREALARAGRLSEKRAPEPPGSSSSGRR